MRHWENERVSVSKAGGEGSGIQAADGVSDEVGGRPEASGPRGVGSRGQNRQVFEVGTIEAPVTSQEAVSLAKGVGADEEVGQDALPGATRVAVDSKASTRFQQCFGL